MASRFLSRISLLMAFERVGERLFGAEWHGFEFQCAERERPPSPKDHSARVNYLVGEAARLRKSMDAVYAARATCLNAEIQVMFEPIIKALNDASSEVGRELNEREGDNQVIDRHETHKRYEAAWARLKKALIERRLEPEADAGGGVDQNVWADATRGKINLRLSTVIRSDDAAEHVITIGKDEFEKWISAIPTQGEEGFDLEAWCYNQITDWVSGKSRPVNKSVALAQLRQAQPKLSQRQFNRIWARCAPKSWKTPGRKSPHPSEKSASKKALNKKVQRKQ